MFNESYKTFSLLAISVSFMLATSSCVPETNSVSIASKDISATSRETTEALSKGMSGYQITQILGNPEEKSVYEDGSTFLNYQRRGISVRMDDGYLSNIFLYSGRWGGITNKTGEFAKYSGKLPMELDFNLSYDDVISLHGLPVDSHDLSFGNIPTKRINYDTVGIEFIEKTGEIITIYRTGNW